MPLFRLARLVCSLAVPAAFAVAAVHAQTGRVYTDADYTRAASQLVWATTPLVDHAVRGAQFLDHDRFWYLETTGGNTTVMLGDAAKGTRREAFDAARMATALQAAGVKVEAGKYVPDAFNISDDDKTARLSVQQRSFKCDLTTYTCTTELPGSTGLTRSGRRSAPAAVLSPDGKKAAFIRDWNLWVRDTATNAETQLTTDGVKDFGYATDNAGWTHSDRAVVLWSPDSKKIATFQQDQRQTGEMYTVSTNVGHPKLDAWKYPLVGDEHVTMIERVIIDVDTPKVTRLQMPPDQHRSTICDDVSCSGGWDDVQWATDAKTLAFVSTSRDHKDETVRIADVATGKVRDVFSEHAATFFESGYQSVNWRYLSDRNEFLWFSQRDNWGNLYLYDATTGKLKHRVTHGDWNVYDILQLDQKTGDMLLLGLGREPGEDPYYRKIYSTNLDGKNLKLLSPEDADHQATVSKDGRYIVDVYSTPHSAPVAVLRDREGKVIEELAHGDLSRLVAAGWIAPETFHVTAHDGKTQVYGLLFKPAHLDPSQKYPVINYIYPGPQGGSFGSHSFLPSRGDSNALAQLGFAVVEIEGMGNPQRSKSFHDTYLNDIGINAIPDQISGMKELATRYPWIDMERTGMWGHSGGGNATAAMMFRYPGFIKVGISESGNHENRNYEDDWDEKWVGLVHKNADGTTNYDSQANAQYAKNLTGKLMLAHGLMDDNVPVSNTLLVVDALEKANKDYDLVIFPHAHHGYGDMSLYMMRRRWDYFVTNLMRATPPHEFKISAPPPPPGM
ncbi:S9 family peptidase [Terriglobus aquaticus]|uniref:S9 family peptidase n=1 Tax=Terriglobus aquaticus TaxID=940139 RepID=A0ABW9KFN1_9BACT|nr:S9 family peptidase [Terriglobus aquaticus]